MARTIRSTVPRIISARGAPRPRNPTVGSIAGARIIAVPMQDADQVEQKFGRQLENLPVVVDGYQEIVEPYALFRRTLTVKSVPPIPSHMEFLIDRRGYIRARWIPGDGPGWTQIPQLLQEIERLKKETPPAPAREEHVH